MNLAAGIVGLPNVGKSTLFNAITAAGAECANYPFCTIEPNVGIVPVPDDRLCLINLHIETKEMVPATLRVVDIAGLVAGASRGEGLGNKFLGHIREVEAIVHVVRCFEDADVAHVNPEIDPISDIGVIETELILADLETAQRSLEKVAKKARSADKEAKAEAAALEAIIAWLVSGKPARTGSWGPLEREVLDRLFLLSDKPVLYVANVDEDDLAGDSPMVALVRAYAESHGSEVVVLCAKLEAELAVMSFEEQAEFLKELGLERPGLHRLVKAAFHLLGLMTFYTAGPVAIRAWTIHRGDKAPVAGAAVHTDFERKFIRAEVYSVDDLLELKSEAAIRAAGRMRVEGKEYVVQDGDVIYFLIGR